jgi:Gpi18-like mannosyltransferase
VKTAAYIEELFREQRISLRLSNMHSFAFAAIILLASLLSRAVCFDVITSDYTIYYEKWIEILRTQPGLQAFAQPFADYPPLYLYLLKLIGFVPIPGVYVVKAISTVCDLLIALFACAILRRASPEKESLQRTACQFSVMLSIPTVLINSSLWGQADSVYAAGIIASAYYIVRGRPLPATIAFAVACCLKLQSIFFLPVLAGFLLARGQLHQLLCVPLVFVCSIMPGVLAGGELNYWMFIYLTQIHEQTDLSVNAPTVFAFFRSVTEERQPNAMVLLFWIGTGLAAMSGIVMTILAAWASRKRSSDMLLLSCALSTAILVFCLPRMHERYLFLADIFAVIYALHRPRCWPAPVLIVSASLLAYLSYLSAALPQVKPFVLDLRIASILAAGGLLMLICSYDESVVRPAAAWIRNISQARRPKRG